MTLQLEVNPFAALVRDPEAVIPQVAGLVRIECGHDIARRFIELVKAAPAMSHRRLMVTEARRLESEARRLSRPSKTPSRPGMDPARADQLRVAAMAIRDVAMQTD